MNPETLQKHRILIVDDDARIVETMAQGLRDLDTLEVHAFTNAQAAREALQQFSFDLMITDYRMPDVDGLTLIREARERSPHTISILMTAFGSPDLESVAENSNVQLYLDKPFDIDDLLGVIKAVFPSPPPRVTKAPVFKVVLGGDANVGKTSLIQRFCTGRFEPMRTMTIGVDFHVYDVRIEQNSARLVVWDLGGQDRFSAARLAFYRGSQAVGLVFDASNRHSFYNLMRWWREVREHLRGIPVVLLANKIDLPRQVAPAETKALANAWGIPFFESSCASGAGVAEFFEALAQSAWRQGQARAPSATAK